MIRYRRTKTAAHTLMELLITLVILDTLTRLSVGGFSRLLAQGELEAGMDNFSALLRKARQRAVTETTFTIICPGQPRLEAGRLTPRCGPRDSWSQGTIAFQDQDGDIATTEDTSLLGATSPLHQQIRIVWRAFRNRPYLLFTPSGLTDWQNGRFVFCQQRAEGHIQHAIVINSAGRTYRREELTGAQTLDPAQCPASVPSASP